LSYVGNGGGGGYYGGGGSIFGANGGGGSSYTDLSVCENTTHTQGFSYGYGKVIITYNAVIKTYIPDDNFELYLENFGMGDGISNNDSVFTHNIYWATTIDVSNYGILDLTGIEDFVSLQSLSCQQNQLTELNLSTLTALKLLVCYNNQLTSLDLSNNLNLTFLDCDINQLNSLNVSENTALTTLHTRNNQLTTLDVSNNPNLMIFRFYNNQLTNLDLRNGNNSILTDFVGTGNSNLLCIDVDDVEYANENFIEIDSQTSFSTDCFMALGCTNINYAEYDQNATIDDGSCSTLGTPIFIPDDNFENFLENNGWGDGIVNNDTVYFQNISEVTELNIYGIGLTNLTGIEHFESLTHLLCHNNQIDSIDISQNRNLTYLLAMNNPPLHYLDTRNGNNHNMTAFGIYDNPNLYCINVDDVEYANENFLEIDFQTSFSTDCTFGCTDESACNYYQYAINDNGSCAYVEDCTGECGGSVLVDCAAVCGGNAEGELNLTASSTDETCSETDTMNEGENGVVTANADCPETPNPVSITIISPGPPPGTIVIFNSNGDIVYGSELQNISFEMGPGDYTYNAQVDCSGPDCFFNINLTN
jgi:hypothetical protein